MDEPRTISKREYDRLVSRLTLRIIAAMGLITFLAVPLSGGRVNGGLLAGAVGGGAMLYRTWAMAWAERILRRRGLTRRGTIVEIRARSPFAPDAAANIEPGERVEARLNPGSILLLLVAAPMLSLFLFAGFWILEDQGLMRWIALGAGAFFLACWIVNLLDYGKPQAWADADGVTGYPSPRAPCRRFVPWSDVYGCEIRTLLDTFGKPCLLVPALKGRDGETLMELSLRYLPMAEQERIVKAIQARFPEALVDARSA